MAKKISKKVYSFSVIYEADPDGGYVVSVPSLPGCYTQGETLEESERNIKEAIGAYLESVARHGRVRLREEKVFQGRVEVAV